MNHLSDTAKGMIFSALGFSLFAVGDAIFKYLSASYDVLDLVFFFGLFALLTYIVTSKKLGGFKRTFQTKNKKLHALRSILIATQVLTAFYAFSQLPLATVYALIFVAPILTSLLAIVILKEQVSRPQWLAIAIGFIGVLVILRPGLIPLDWATIAAITAAIVVSSANIIVRFLDNRETSLSLALYPQILILTMMLPFVIIDFRMPALSDLIWMIAGGLLSASGMLGLIKGFSKAAAAKAAPFHYIQMLWGVGLGYVIFGDIPDLWTGIGALIIIASGFWLIRHSKKDIPDLGGS